MLDKNAGRSGVVLRIVADSEQAVEAMRMEEALLRERYGVELKFHYPERLTDDLEDYLFATQQQHDIFVLFPAKIPAYVARGWLRPLDAYTAKSPWMDDISPVYRELYMRFDDHDYGMVYDGDAHLLFYRKDVFGRFADAYRKQFGEELEPPRTWEQYDRIAKFLTVDEDGDGQPEMYGTASFGAPAKRYVWFSERFLSAGGRYFDDEMRPVIDGPEGLWALQSWLALERSGACPPHAMYDWIDLNQAFLTGKLAMVVQWSDTARFSFDDRGPWKSKVAGKVGWSLVPGTERNGPRGGVWIGRVLAVSSNPAHPELAWRVIEHVTSPEATARALQSPTTVSDPFRLSHFRLQGRGAFPTAEVQRDFLNVLEQSLRHAGADLMIESGWEYMRVLNEQIGLAMLGKAEPQQALRETAARWEELTNRIGRDRQKRLYRAWLQRVRQVSALP